MPMASRSTPSVMIESPSGTRACSTGKPLRLPLAWKRTCRSMRGTTCARCAAAASGPSPASRRVASRSASWTRTKQDDGRPRRPDPARTTSPREKAARIGASTLASRARWPWRSSRTTGDAGSMPSAVTRACRSAAASPAASIVKRSRYGACPFHRVSRTPSGVISTPASTPVRSRVMNCRYGSTPQRSKNDAQASATRSRASSLN